MRLEPQAQDPEPTASSWVAVKEPNLNYHHRDIQEIVWFLNYGNLILLLNRKPISPRTPGRRSAPLKKREDPILLYYSSPKNSALLGIRPFFGRGFRKFIQATCHMLVMSAPSWRSIRRIWRPVTVISLGILGMLCFDHATIRNYEQLCSIRGLRGLQVKIFATGSSIGAV